jgi:allantoinase
MSVSAEIRGSEMEECRFDYLAMRGRPVLEMPQRARIAVWVGVNIEYYDFNENIATLRGDQVPPPSPSGFGWYQYGMRVGIFRLMEIMAERGIRGSVLLNSDVCEAYPGIIDAGNQLDWVWLGHGQRNRIDSNSFASEAEELEHLREMVVEIERKTGSPPKGWLGPGLSESFHTPDLLAELGLTYVCDWVADDQPFPLRVRSGRMINVPYVVDGLNDVRLRGQAFTGDDYYRLITDQFDQLYADGASNPRVMCIAIHPPITGQPFRAKHFARALDYIRGHNDVWFPTSDEIADWYYRDYYVAP